jgi:hypothetical protein
MEGRPCYAGALGRFDRGSASTARFVAKIDAAPCGMSSPRACLHQMICVDLRRIAALLVLATAVGGFPSDAVATVSVDVAADQGAVVIAASASLKADAATAWNVLTAYDRYARFIPGVRSSTVVARRGGAVTVEQFDDAVLWPARWPFRIVYEIREMPPDRLESRASATVLPPLQSTYLLTPTPGGVRLEYTGRVAAGFIGPGEVEQWAIKRAVLRQFEALAHEIERNASGVAATGD